MTTLGLCCLYAVGAAATAATPHAVVSATPPPIVLMVRSAATVEGQRHERRLFDELGFALDGFMVLNQAADRADFGSLPLAEQLADVLPEAHKNGAIVVVWLSFPLSNQVMLHLVAIGSGRALIRTIETNRSPISEATLALMTRELLGTAYLFESPKDVPVEVAEVVQSVKKQIPAESPPLAPPPPPPSSPWSAWLRTQANYPLSGGEDAVPVWRLGAAAERRCPLGLEGGLGLVGSYGAVLRPNTPGAQFLAGGATATVYRGFATRGLSGGPYAGATLAYASFRGPYPPLGVVVPSIELGAQARSETEVGPSVALNLAVAYSPVRAELRTGDGQVLFRTASFELMLGLAVGWRGL